MSWANGMPGAGGAGALGSEDVPDCEDERASAGLWSENERASAGLWSEDERASAGLWSEDERASAGPKPRGVGDGGASCAPADEHANVKYNRYYVKYNICTCNLSRDWGVRESLHEI